jgi:hypothetical protein
MLGTVPESEVSLPNAQVRRPSCFHLQAERGREKRQARHDDLAADQRPDADVELGAVRLHEVGVARP